MEHENVYQCVQSINDALILKDQVILDRGQFVREAEGTIDILENKCAELQTDKEMINVRLSELQCAYAEVEQEKEDRDKMISDLRSKCQELLTKNSELGATQESDRADIKHLRNVVDNLHTQISDMITEKREAKPDKQAGVHTTRLYWDCNCAKDYINHSYITRCEICGAHNVDQPDSRLEELGMARLSGINELAERYARSNK